MPVDPTYNQQNRTSTQRMKDLAARLTDEQLQTKIGEHWTVAIVFAHLAFWDRRVLAVLDLTEKNGKLTVPEVDISVNDLSLPFWAAIPARESVRLGVEAAEALDERLEHYNPKLLEEVYNHLQRWVIRAGHRNLHLEEVEETLKNKSI
jgi:hypothetical protein